MVLYYYGTGYCVTTATTTATTDTTDRYIILYIIMVKGYKFWKNIVVGTL